MNPLKMLKKRLLIGDGAMGTNLARLACARRARNSQHPTPKSHLVRLACARRARKSQHPTPKPQNLVCSESYNLYAPEIVGEVHRGFIDVGCDLIELNTFNANRISLSEYGLEGQVKEINLAAVSIAKGVVEKAGRDVLISLCIGPTSKLPSLGQISFDQMYDAYLEQVSSIIEAGVDLIQIDTCQDILQAKIAVIACRDIFEKVGRDLPIIVCVTIDSSGKMLLGTEPDAVLSTLIPLGVSAIGLNCGMGPKGMAETVRYLAHHSPLPVAVLPNAGLPEIVDGETHYNLSAAEFADQAKYFVKELGVEIIGGCCGTTHEHLSAVVKKIRGIKPANRKNVWPDSLSSLFSSTTIRQRPAPLIIGERMNINGSKKFKRYLLADDFDASTSLAQEQEASGAHALDISVAYAGRDEVSDFQGVLKRIVTHTRLPICIDSTCVDSIEAALKYIPGRAIINSINLEDGGEKARNILNIAKRYGAALIALTIDADGMAKDRDKKLKIAEDLIRLAKEYGIDESSLFIDLLTFTLADPNAASYGSAVKTLEAIKKIKKTFPKINTILGVSNVSYGFDRKVRKILNSVFLHEALKVGLDAAIVHVSQIVPLSKIDDGTQKVALDLIWNKKEDDLDRFVKYFQGKDIDLDEPVEGVSPEEGARLCVIRGDKSKIENILGELIKTHKPQEILNGILLPAMDEVGRLFDKGKIPLPFVLQSAEVMKKATDYLAPHFDTKTDAKKGKVVLATVKGDVHDIGKNLVDIVFSNNGLEVINIGVKQPIENILKAALENKADVIGLSGLLVESALIMKDDLAELAHKGVTIPVICGGAALTEKFVKKELAAAYKAPVYYAKDAFDGLKIVEKLATPSPPVKGRGPNGALRPWGDGRGEREKNAMKN